MGFEVHRCDVLVCRCEADYTVGYDVIPALGTICISVRSFHIRLRAVAPCNFSCFGFRRLPFSTGTPVLIAYRSFMFTPVPLSSFVITLLIND